MRPCREDASESWAGVGGWGAQRGAENRKGAHSPGRTEAGGGRAAGAQSQLSPPGATAKTELEAIEIYWRK